MYEFVSSGLIIQLIGLFAAGFYIALFQVNNRTKMLSLKICGSLVMSVHLALLGASTGAAMTLVSAARDTTFIVLGKRRNPAAPAVFIFIFTIAAIGTWEGLISLLALAGMILGTLAFWQLKPNRIRILTLIASSLWVVYDLVSGSYPGMFIESMAILSNLVGIYRFDLPKHSKRGG